MKSNLVRIFSDLIYFSKVHMGVGRSRTVRITEGSS
jgi:hypothetical protein